MKARLSKDFYFEAAQTLTKVPPGHKCGYLHGHSFKVEIVVEGVVDPEEGWVYDHAEISRAMEPLLEIIDHKYLNELPGLSNPTIEWIAVWFWEKLTEQGLRGLVEVIIHETPTARCIYRGE